MRFVKTGFRLPLFLFVLCLLPVVLAGCVRSFKLPGNAPVTVDISGVVLSSEGTPVPEAQVEINQRTTTTGQDGTFALAGVLVPDGRAWYKVSAANYGTRTGSVLAARGTPVKVDVTLPRTLLVGTGTVTGTLNFTAQPYVDQRCHLYNDIWPFTHHPMHSVADVDLTPTEVIVDVIGAPTETLAEILARDTGAASYRLSNLIHRIILGVPYGMDAEAFSDSVRLHPEVVEAYVNSIVVTSSIPPATYAAPPNDECYYAQHHLPQIQAPWAWTVTTGSRGVVVGVLDSGVYTGHPDLRDHLIPGWNFVEDNDRMMDLTGHGTHVAGLIGAVGSNGMGVTGVAQQVSILPIRVFRLLSATVEQIVAGILYAADQGVDVLNASYNSPIDTPLIREAFEYALSRGVIVVASVGNAGPYPDTVMWPAKYEGIIGVGALGSGRTVIGDYSARGEGVDLVAPGEEVWSLSTDDGYVTGTGTSMAAPVVSGVIALMLANGIAHAQVEEILYRTAVRVGDPESIPDDRATYGWGIVNAYAAVLGLDPADTLLFVVNGQGDIVGTVTSPDNRRRFTVTDLPQGDDLSLIGWIDVNYNGLVDLGDYFGSRPFSLDEGGGVSVELLLDVYDLEEPLVYDLRV